MKDFLKLKIVFTHRPERIRNLNIIIFLEQLVWFIIHYLHHILYSTTAKSAAFIEITDTMLFNFFITSLAFLFSTIVIVNTSPVPNNDGLALYDLIARRDISILGRDIGLERRQKGGPGGPGAGTVRSQV
jgi:hypothetical protein